MGSPEKVANDIMSSTRGRMKKICCCGFSWFLLGAICVLIGILLLVYYSQYFSDNDWKRGLAYTGIVFLLLGIIMVGVGITFCVALKIVWNRLDKSGDFAKHQFHPPTYAPGEAPYPQQGTTSPVYTQVSSSDHASQPSQPSAPSIESPVKSADDNDVNDVRVEIDDHHKF